MAITQADIQAFRSTLSGAKTIFITAHVGPDGDTLGSMLGLKHSLQAVFPQIERIDCVISGKMPEVYRFMPGLDWVQSFDHTPNLLETYDVAISVDCGAASRLGDAQAHFERAPQSLNIDHHVSNDRFGTVNIIDVEAGASGEVVADLLFACGASLSPEAATCLYVAVLTDTGGFKYSNTSAKIFDLMASLTRSGANPEDIYRHIYEEQPKSQAMLLADTVRSAQFNADETLCWAVVMQSKLAEFGASDEHLDGLVEALRRIQTVVVSAVIRETRSGITKVSLRSDRPEINVAEIMARWGGGGHKMAAGCTMHMTPTEAEAELLPVLKETVAAYTRALAVN